MNKNVKFLIVIIVCFFLISFFYFQKNWCRQIQKGGVFLENKELSDSLIYDGGNNDIILLVVENEEEKGVFLISQKNKEVAFLSRNDFFVFPYGLYSRYYPYHAIIIKEKGDKTDTNPELMSSSNEISFKYHSEKPKLTIKFQ